MIHLKGTDMNWQIEWMRTLPQSAALPGYVVDCGWRCTGTEKDQTASVYGSCSFSVPENADGSFIPYASLTEQQVLGWVWSSGVDKDATEKAVQTQLDNLINPPVVQPALPWAKD